jgi:DNA-binding CsgD family transcriptional regulator
MMTASTPDSDSFKLNEDDFRAVVHLLGVVAGGSESCYDKRKMLMDGMCELIGADAWVWGASPRFEAGHQPVYAMHQTGGFGLDRFAKLILATEHPDSGSMTSPLMEALAAQGRHVTRLRQQIIPNERFESSPAFPLWVHAKVGPLMISARSMSDGRTSVIGIYRDISKPLFTGRESKIAHILLSEVDWLHDEQPHEQSRSLPGLSPRCRLVFQQLLFGRSRREIADMLNISLHTANDYVKEIFRHFGVHSAQELIARFCVGDGREVA